MSDESVSPEMENEMRVRFLDQILTNLGERAEDWTLILTPLGDAIGFRAEIHVGSPDPVFLAGASHLSGLVAATNAITRGLIRLEEILEDEDADADEVAE